MKRRRSAWVGLAAAALLCSNLAIAAQGDAREALLAPLDEEMARAEQEELKLLSPNYHEKARRSHRKASEDIRRGRRLDGIQKTIANAREALEAGFEAAALTRVAVAGALEVRSEVLQFRRLATKSEFWKAMEEIRKAGEKIERDDLKGARKHGREAERRFRRTAIQYLKDDLLRDARDLLKSSRNMMSKDERATAERTLKEVEQRVKKLKDRDPFSVAEVVGGARDDLAALFPALTGR